MSSQAGILIEIFGNINKPVYIKIFIQMIKYDYILRRDRSKIYSKCINIYSIDLLRRTLFHDFQKELKDKTYTFHLEILRYLQPQL